jgi:hypothetical protein
MQDTACYDADLIVIGSGELVPVACLVVCDQPTFFVVTREFRVLYHSHMITKLTW